MSVDGESSSLLPSVQRARSGPAWLGPRAAGWGTRLLALRVNSSADLFVPDPPSCVRHVQNCAHVKDPVSICRKRVSLKASGIVTPKYCMR